MELGAETSANEEGEDAPNEATRPSIPYVARHSRRLTDKILGAFHQACDLGDFHVADQLLQLLEMMTTRSPRPEDGDRRRNIQGLVAAHERLWHLRHPPTE